MFSMKKETRKKQKAEDSHYIRTIRQRKTYIHTDRQAHRPHRRATSQSDTDTFIAETCMFVLLPMSLVSVTLVPLRQKKKNTLPCSFFGDTGGARQAGKYCKQVFRYTGRQTGKQASRFVGKQMSWLADRKVGKQLGRRTSRQISWQLDTQKGRQSIR